MKNYLYQVLTSKPLIIIKMHKAYIRRESLSTKEFEELKVVDSEENSELDLVALKSSILLVAT